MFLVLAILVEVEEFPVVKRDRGGAGELEQQLLVTVIRTNRAELVGQNTTHHLGHHHAVMIDSAAI